MIEYLSETETRLLLKPLLEVINNFFEKEENQIKFEKWKKAYELKRTTECPDQESFDSSSQDNITKINS